MKLSWLLSLIIAVALAAHVSAQKKKEFVGYEHKGVIYGATLPNGAKDLGGGLLSNENYGVSRFSKDGKFMLWLERITKYGADGVPTWKVKDVLTFHTLKKNREFLFSHSSSCLQNGAENLDLIVLAEFLQKTKNYKILDAWQAHIGREKFKKVPNKGIICRYDAP